MHLLDAGGTVVGHGDMHIRFAQQAGHPAAGAPGQRQYAHLSGLRGPHGFDDARRIAAGAERHQHVAGQTQRPHLLGEHMVETVIVRHGGEGGGVGGEGDGGQFGALALEAADQFRGQMLTVGGRSAVAADQNLVPIRHRRRQHIDGARDRPGQRLGRLVLQIGAVEKMLLDTLL